MTLAEFFAATPSLINAQHTERIRAFGWFLQSSEGEQRPFSVFDIRMAYRDLGLASPSNFSQLFAQLEERQEVLARGTGFILERRVFNACTSKYGRRPIAIHVDKLLSDLPAKVPNVSEREFLEETLRCYRAEAFRAAIVMGWNLAYHHLCAYLLARHRDGFSRQVPLRYPNKKLTVASFNSHDDLAELKESEVIAVCKSAAIITPDIARILEEKLGKRNSAAHPSSVSFSQIQVDAYIEDLITNVVLKLN